uniref:Uncharacterized protein n=1 Tax=Cercocebus atys TaxID=9531 RepID=A0A2K5NEA4_CERAT
MNRTPTSRKIAPQSHHPRWTDDPGKRYLTRTLLSRALVYHIKAIVKVLDMLLELLPDD